MEAAKKAKAKAKKKGKGAEEEVVEQEAEIQDKGPKAEEDFDLYVPASFERAL